jgi:hypothetical protein
MKPIPLNDETKALAERLVWFESPAEALADPIRFIAYAFARATHEDMKVLRIYVDDDDLNEALDKAPPRHHRPAFMVLLEFAYGPVSSPAATQAAIGVRQ